ncbi:MAG: ParB/RepB/Spo0J family partition protein, partial [Candidatus Methylumidiphilus sp.]
MSKDKAKKLSAMDLLLNSAALKPAMSQSSPLSRSAIANLRAGTPVEISPHACRLWKLADRPASETGHKAELAASFRQAGLGQIQPIVVREVKDPATPAIQYEVVCGQVRWLAALQLDVPVQAIVRELDDREAYVLMSVENRLRRRLSDYAKAKSYQQTLQMGIFDSAQALALAEGISQSKLSVFLGF